MGVGQATDAGKMVIEEIELKISPDVKQKLESRGIRDEEVSKAIHNAEEKGEKLYLPGEKRYLAKLMVGEVTYYVEYSVAEPLYVVRTAYCHQSKIEA